jgi:branched-chain amino acid transport system substrate-binding protein
MKNGKLAGAIATAVLGTSMLLSGCGNSFGGSASNSSSTSQSASKDSGVIKIGTLYAQSGSYATSSMPEYEGLKFWADQVNKNGGITVNGKKDKVQIVAYNDQSDSQTATNLYNQLITQDKVDVLVSDFGSVLTSVAVPIAKEHKMLLFDQTGTGANFFTADNPYIVLTSLRTSAMWPESLAKYIVNNKIKKVAIMYDSNDFTQSQEETLTSLMKTGGITPVYDHAVDTSTSNYTVLLHNIAALNPDMVVEFGYSNNDLPFLQNIQAGNYNFKKVFTVFPGQLPELFEKNLGNKALADTYTYPAPPLIAPGNVNYGMTLDQFEPAYKTFSGEDVNFLSVAGYNTGLVIQKALETTKSMSQTDLRAAVASFSGDLNTLDGNFQINDQGSQIGEELPVGQWKLQTDGSLKINVVQ